ncbi:hypothetical protein M3Y97_01075200 [Aphelenchoides bicaudatus]|nr:hypothetical protein M3Y97_01075200 [Aphelenchoides bicaudatus]
MSSTIQIDDPIKKRSCQKIVIYIVGTFAVFTLVTLLAVCGLFAYTMITREPIVEASQSNEVTKSSPLYDIPEVDLTFCNNRKVYFKGKRIKDRKNNRVY